MQTAKQFPAIDPATTQRRKQLDPEITYNFNSYMFHNILSNGNILFTIFFPAPFHSLHKLPYAISINRFCLLILSHFRSCTCTHNLETQYRLSFLPFCNRVCDSIKRFDMLEKRYRFLQTESIVEMKKEKTADSSISWVARRKLSQLRKPLQLIILRFRR